MRGPIPVHIQKLVIALLALSILTSIAFASCPKNAESLSEAEILAYLRTARDHPGYNTACTDRLLRYLSVYPDDNSISTLIDYLSFQNPAALQPLHGFNPFHPDTDRFPAVYALAHIGEKAAIPLLTVLASGKLPELQRKNAIEAYILGFRDQPSGIARMLKYVPPSGATAETSEHMRRLAMQAAQMCVSSMRAACLSAAQK